MRAVIFANGQLRDPQVARAAIRPGDLLVCADGGLRHCMELGLTPSILIGDFDSLHEGEIAAMRQSGVEIIQYPTHKNHTDLELAIHHTRSLGINQILVLGALGARWDQTLANLLLPASANWKDVSISLLDGIYEIHLLHGNAKHALLSLNGSPGDTISLIPLAGDASGITTTGLEYPLHNGKLVFGATRGISNTLLGDSATVSLRKGVLMCIVIHHPSTD